MTENVLTHVNCCVQSVMHLLMFAVKKKTEKLANFLNTSFSVLPVFIAWTLFYVVAVTDAHLSVFVVSVASCSGCSAWPFP